MVEKEAEGGSATARQRLRWGGGGGDSRTMEVESRVSGNALVITSATRERGAETWLEAKRRDEGRTATPLSSHTSRTTVSSTVSPSSVNPASRLYLSPSPPPFHHPSKTRGCVRACVCVCSVVRAGMRV